MNLFVSKGEISLLYVWIVFDREQVDVIESKLNLRHGKDPNGVNKDATLMVSETKS